MIDRKIRNFIWGCNEGERKIHLVDWNTMTMPKERGGLGIRRTDDMNMAFMAKMGWRIEKEKDKLWVHVLSHKYNGGNEGINGIVEKQGSSNIWKGTNEAKQILRKGIRMHAYNGKEVRFWED